MKLLYLSVYRKICQKGDSMLFFLFFFFFILIYSFLCVSFSLFPIIVLIYLIGNFRLLDFLLNRFMFHFTRFLLIFVFILLLLNFLIQNLHLAYTDFELLEPLSISLVNFKQNFLFNDNYNPSGGIPISTKESSFENSIYNVKICHQQIESIDEHSKFVLLFSEQARSVLGKNVFKSNYPNLPEDQLFLLKHYLNVLKIHNYVAEDGSKNSLVCVNGYTHAHKTALEYSNIRLASTNLYGGLRSQYSTPLYQVNSQFLKFMQQSDLKLDRLSCDVNQVIPIKFFTHICKHSGFLVTGERSFLDESLPILKSGGSYPFKGDISKLYEKPPLIVAREAKTILKTK